MKEIYKMEEISSEELAHIEGGFLFEIIAEVAGYLAAAVTHQDWNSYGDNYGQHHINASKL